MQFLLDFLILGLEACNRINLGLSELALGMGFETIQHGLGFLQLGIDLLLTMNLTEPSGSALTMSASIVSTTRRRKPSPTVRMLVRYAGNVSLERCHPALAELTMANSMNLCSAGQKPVIWRHGQRLQGCRQSHPAPISVPNREVIHREAKIIGKLLIHKRE